MGPGRGHREILRPARSRSLTGKTRYMAPNENRDLADSKIGSLGRKRTGPQRPGNAAGRSPQPTPGQHRPLRTRKRSGGGIQGRDHGWRPPDQQTTAYHHLRRRLRGSPRSPSGCRGGQILHRGLAPPDRSQPKPIKDADHPHHGKSGRPESRIRFPWVPRPTVPSRKALRQPLLQGYLD